MWCQSLSRIKPELVKRGVAEVIAQRIAWPPNLPKFLELCEGLTNESESFDRFIERHPPKDTAEYLTRNKIGFKCRTQMREEDARKLWRSTITAIRKRIASGEIQEHDLSAARIETPEQVKKNLTPEQRNQQLDRQINEMLKNNQPLIGPFKKRYLEREK